MVLLSIAQDARSIDADLACLPVWLAGCSTLVVLFGPTWTSRLWCVLELYVFLQVVLLAQPVKFSRLKDAIVNTQMRMLTQRNCISLPTVACPRA